MVAAALAGPGIVTPAVASSTPASFADLAAGLMASVVNISTRTTVSPSGGLPMPDVPQGSPFQQYFGNPANPSGEGGSEQGGDERSDGQGDSEEGQDPAKPKKVESLGSGFVIDASGLIITNNHVIENADEIIASFADGTKLTAKLVGHDAKTDLALLKVTPKLPLTAVKFGDSGKLRIGDWVLAIGNPFGFGGSLTAGIVSALNRDINAGPYDSFIQTDAAINRGNSGGPLFNMEGEVIGINTAIVSPTGGSIGIGFAVPTEIAAPVIEQLRQYGQARRGFIGVRIQEVGDEVARSLGMDKPHGALVAGISDGGPAAKAGLRPGDVVITFNGQDVNTSRDLPRLVADTPAGRVVDVVVIRDGQPVTLRVPILLAQEGDEPKPEGGTSTHSQGGSVLGMTVETLSAANRKQYNVAPDVRGLVVTAVSSGSTAEDNKMQPGDVVLEINQTAVDSPDDLQDKVGKLRQAGRKTALLLVTSAGRKLHFVTLALNGR
ncbi:serine protease Do [Faunimonas pinastri]|uniref:Probable periplasmic serine endoprotease DegP-like n=1 Tax=Faunimonas pinastri TaxID=1855383 RepID=A0A1H9FM16_9HYPH|nr:Do family serine endopeptidase [Faunimonas pinastri]SEQ38926.1 serine protease Do [Faunimonas pinastri]